MLTVMIVYPASLNHFRITNIPTDTGYSCYSHLFPFSIHKVSFHSIYFLRSKSLGHIHLYVLDEKENKQTSLPEC